MSNTGTLKHTLGDLKTSNFRHTLHYFIHIPVDIIVQGGQLYLVVSLNKLFPQMY